MAKLLKIKRTKTEIPAGFEEVSHAGGSVLAKTGDTVFGEYVGPGKSRKMGEGKRKRDVPFFKVKIDDGSVVEVLGSFQIVEFFGGIVKGDGVFIEKTGQENTRGGQRVNTYRLAVKRKRSKK